jgi:hypothetical protein
MTNFKNRFCSFGSCTPTAQLAVERLDLLEKKTNENIIMRDEQAPGEQENLQGIRRLVKRGEVDQEKSILLIKASQDNSRLTAF